MNLQMFKLHLEKAEEPRSNCQHPLNHWKSKRILEKHLFLLYWLCQNLWLCGSQQTVENSSRDGNTRPSDLPSENLYAGQEATVWTGNGTMDWCQIRKGVCQGCILLPCLYSLYAEYIMWNAGLDEARDGIKISVTSYSNDTTLMAESEEELKNLLMKVKEESGLELNIQKKQRLWHPVPSLHGK